MAVIPINYIEVRDGKTVIAGTRITIKDIVALYVMNHSPIEWIVENYSVTPAQIHAALSYYYDHQEEIDRAMREDEEALRQGAISADEHLAQLRARLPKTKDD
jgi:uncharacterized protein (DUF433 family)